MQKSISVVVAGSGEIKDVAIAPSATAKQILDEAGLQGYQLSRKGGDVLDNDADIFNLVADKEKLYATPEDVSVGVSTASPSGDLINLAVKLIGTRRLYPEVLRKHATLTGTREFKLTKITKTDSTIPYWQENNWIKTAKGLKGSYKTDYGVFRGLIERNFISSYSFYIFDPPQALKDSSHWQCFSYKGNDKFHIHFSEKPKNVDSGIITVEALITNAFKNHNGGAKWKPGLLDILNWRWRK